MSKKERKPAFHLENVVITGIADKGRAVGRHTDGKVVFVENAVPGDTVQVRVFKARKGYYEGRMTELVTPSPDRETPYCAHFGVCGGCKWQNLSYAAQLRHKQQTVIDALVRIGRVPESLILQILAAPETNLYRNKLEYTFSSRRWLTEAEIDLPETMQEGGIGFHKSGQFDKIIPIEKCYHQVEPSNAIRNAVRDFAYERGYELYDFRAHTGWLRTLMIRTAAATGQVMVLVQFHDSCPDDKRTDLLEFLKTKFPEITSLVYVINPKLNDTIHDLEVHLYHGATSIEEHLGTTKYKISPKSFFQTNSKQAENLYRLTAEAAQLSPDDNVYDLYTGTGSIACFIADKVKKVVGIEEIDAAVRDAHINAELNGLKNVDFYVGDVKNILTPEFAAKHGKPDVVITDPPRAGMHTDVVRYLLELAAPRLVYVSCNPATQARDLELLSARYDVVQVQPVDMFPQTHHIESVAQLRLRE